ncbi:ribonuclease H-like domain-containing protein [Tanacetum coccineum]
MNRKRGVSNTSTNTQRPPPSTKKVHKPCFNFNKGVCRFGEYCKFLHNGVHGSPSRSTKTSTEPHNDDMQTLKNLMDKLGFDANDLAPGNWNMDTGASSHLNDFVSNLSDVSNMCIYSSFSVGDGYSIPVNNFSHRLPYSSGDEVLRRVTNPLTIPHAFLTSQYTWHQHLGYPRNEVLRRVLSSNSISCNKEKLPVLCHAWQTREASIC